MVRSPFATLAIAALLCAAPSLSAAAPMKTPSWKQIQALVDQQKFEAALEGTQARLAQARGGTDEAEWTHALVQTTQLEIGLHGYETAVRFLKDQPWPKGALSRVTLNLVYAWALTTYAEAYSWEINQRERVEQKGPIDLKAWTMEQIRTEANQAYADIWRQRAELGHTAVTALKQYVQPNDYPKGIRDTLRDAVSYLWVQMLADSSGWRPEQSNELFRLDLPALIAGAPATSKDIALDDPSVHPMVRIGAILDDLESWHLASHRRAAALEARLVRLRTLHASFTEPADRALIRADLADRLPGFRDLPWFSMGKATLAELWRDVGNLPKARQIAQEGAAAYPDSVGGKRCLNLQESIEAPDFQLQAMSSDGPDRRSIAVEAKNVPTLYFRAYAVAPQTNGRIFPDTTDAFLHGLSRKTPAAAWKVELPGTPDFQPHRTFITPPLTAHGPYVILASANAAFDGRESRTASTRFLLTDLVLISRQEVDGSHEASVVEGSTGKPVSGATVSLWRSYPLQLVGSKDTDAKGEAAWEASAALSGSFFLTARKGHELAVDSSGFGFYPRYQPPLRPPSALIFTDRSIYRPQQTLDWKVVSYVQSDPSHYHVAPGAPVTVDLLDANGQKVESRQVTTNEFGSAAGQFTIPSGRLLGNWSLRTTPNGYASIRVEEYKRPTFETKLKDPENPLRLNKPANLVGEAHYYFGLPVTSGSVRWRVTREPLYPWWWGFWFAVPRGQAQVVATGASALGADGTYPISFTPAADERQAHAQDITYRYVVSADVTDEGGETRSASQSYRLGFVSVEARISSEGAFFREGQPVDLSVSRTNLDGIARPGQGSWRVVSVKQPNRAVTPAELPTPRPVAPASDDKDAPPQVRTPGDMLRPRWESNYSVEATIASWSDGDLQASGEVTHDAKGLATVHLASLPPGVYRLRYQTTDDFGSRFETFKDFVVAGEKTQLSLPAVLWAESSGVKVGEKARFLVASGLPDQPMVFDVFRNGHRIDRRYLTSGHEPDLIEVPVSEEDRGGFSVSLSLVRDYQFISLSASVFVPWDDRELKLEFATFRDKIRPGAKETWRVIVKSPQGKPVERNTVELLAYMFDQSLDIFGPHVPPSVASLYPNREGTDNARASVVASWAQWLSDSSFPAIPPYPPLTEDAIRFYEGYGIGGPGIRGRRGMRMMALTTRGAVPAAQAPAPMEKKAAGKDMAMREEAEGAPPPPPPSPPAVEMRENFAETAFWKPQLLTGADGSAIIEFTVPDSVTAWNVWVHALTRDLRGGSLETHTRSVKELMVRPYLPRFLREGDQAAIKVVVNNASDRTLSGKLWFDVIDPDTQKSVLGQFGLTGSPQQAFTVQAGKGTDLTFPITAPKRVGQVAFKVVATSGDLSDGELRPLPILPSRVHLAQSRFVTLRDKDQRTMTFDDLAKNDDPTRVNEQLVVTLDAQLFYTVLQAIPYLINYPYECTEQTLNRFLSTGIVSSVYQQYPAVARMAEKLSARQTPLETWDAVDPNRKMALEETPWVVEAKGGQDVGLGTVNVLDQRVAKAEREASLAKLRKAQTSEGGFPWWPGGPPSEYMTLYILHGFARAAEFKVDVPKDMVQRGWQYLADAFHKDYAHRMEKDDCCWEFITFLNYVASSYPDASWTGNALTPDERQRMLDFSFKHWKEHSPYLKGYLALTLARAGRQEDARLVWDSVMDSSKTTQDEGTFWAREDRSWLWYNDTIETEAFALRTLTELEPQDARRHGLVQWLLLNRKLNHWKSTRATAEVIYALVKYLEHEGELGTPEDAHVAIGSRSYSFLFKPDEYTGKKNQIVVPGPEIDPKRDATVTVEKTTKGFEFASATWQFSTDQLPAEDRGDFFGVSRAYFKREKGGREVTLRPLAEGEALHPGDEVEVQISIRSKHEAEYVHLRDPRPAGLEPENAVSRYKWDLGIGWYEETRDSGTNFFFEHLPVGEYTFKYRLRANMAGTFRIGPATLQSMYAPEFNAYSAGAKMTIAP